MRVGSHLAHLPPLALLSGKRNTRLGVVHEKAGRTLLQVHSLGRFGSTTKELDLPGPLTHWAGLHHEGQDLIVGAGADEFLRVWNPVRLDRPPLVIPLPGPAEDLTTAAPDLVCVLVEEHWTALRLTDLDALCAS
ncbi:hypothetical protein ACGFYQ_27790 [Streptomyces sp. NPDC048258]|uniref:hypothetical protein n=1 Tax=Streptomyces sp. NPDC048258 TaxID=3365527 RepID=UPI0037243433